MGPIGFTLRADHRDGLLGVTVTPQQPHSTYERTVVRRRRPSTSTTRKGPGTLARGLYMSRMHTRLVRTQGTYCRKYPKVEAEASTSHTKRVQSVPAESTTDPTAAVPFAGIASYTSSTQQAAGIASYSSSTQAGSRQQQHSAGAVC